MKVAIIVWGFYRQFETAVQFWDETYSRYNPDYFFALWDESIERCTLEEFPFNIHKKVEKKDITDRIPNANVSLYKHKEIKLPANSKVYYLINEAIESILASNQEYDAIIVKRADTFEWFGYNLLEELEENTVYTYSGRKSSEDGIPLYDFGDIIFYGSSKSIISFIKGLANSEYYKSERGAGPHKEPDMFLRESNINNEKFPGKYFWQVVRPIFLHLFSEKKPLVEFIQDNQEELDLLEDKWIYIRSNKKKFYSIYK